MNIRFTSVFFVLAFLISCQENNTSRLDTNAGEQTASSPLDSINSLIKESPNAHELYFERAKLHYGSKDLASSLSDVGRALKLDSGRAEYYILLADLKLISKESRASRDALLKAHKISPDNADVLIKLGELYMIVRDADASFTYLNKALKLDVYNAKAYRLKGFNYKYLGDTANAVSSFQTAVEQDASDYDSYLQLGFIYASIEHEIAEDYFKNALSVRPESIEALYALGLHYQTTGRPREAIEAYHQITDLNEAYWNAYYNIGWVYLELIHAYDSSAQFFTKAIQYGPQNYYEAVYNRGLCYERQSKLAEAEQEYRSALKMNPQYDAAAHGLSRVLGE